KADLGQRTLVIVSLTPQAPYAAIMIPRMFHRTSRRPAFSSLLDAGSGWERASGHGRGRLGERGREMRAPRAYGARRGHCRCRRALGAGLEVEGGGEAGAPGAENLVQGEVEGAADGEAVSAGAADDAKGGARLR